MFSMRPINDIYYSMYKKLLMIFMTVRHSHSVVFAMARNILQITLLLKRQRPKKISIAVSHRQQMIHSTVEKSYILLFYGSA